MATGTFYPSLSYISSVTQGQNSVVGFTLPHDFTDGEIISFRVSPPFGMVELNYKQSRVLSHTTMTVTVAIDSTNYTPFINAGIYKKNPAIAVPAGSGIIPRSDPATVNLEDAFDNKPPI